MKNKYYSKKVNRNDAFSINIADNSSDKNDSVQYLINLQGSFFSFTNNGISELLPAEKIDPDNLHSDTRHSYQKIYSIGCENSYVARTIIQTKQILDSLILNKSLDKQTILNHVWDCSKLLFKCEESHYNIYGDIMKLMPVCDSVIEQGKKGSSISTLPQVNDLEGQVAIFLGNAKRYLEKTHELLCLFYKASNNDANFEAYRAWTGKNMPDRNTIIELLEQDKDWIQIIAWSRNALEINHSEPQFDVKIENFKLNPGNKFSSPRWKYDFSARQGPVHNDFSDILIDMDVYLSNLLTFFEELFVCCIQDSCDEKYNFEICKQQSQNIDIKCPTVYFVSRKRKHS